MEAAFMTFRMVFAVVATIVAAAVTFQMVVPASGEPTRMPAPLCPPHC